MVGAVISTGWVDEWDAHPAYTPTYFLGIGLYGLQGWAWAAAALGAGMRVVRFGRPLLGSIADSAMPFFLIHQPVILALAFFVVRWDAGIMVKLPVLVVDPLSQSLRPLPMIKTELARCGRSQHWDGVFPIDLYFEDLAPLITDLDLGETDL